MNPYEGGKRIGGLGMKRINNLLISSSAAYLSDYINMPEAVWFGDNIPPTLVLEMTTSCINQGWNGIVNGGFTAKLIDLVGGTAAAVVADQQFDKMIVLKHSELDYHMAIPINKTILTVAQVESVEAENRAITTLVRVMSTDKTTVYTTGTLFLRIIDFVRLSNENSLRT